jgi:hypothetical protein
VAARFGTAAGDDVRAVGAVLADRPQELATTGYRLSECRAQFDRRTPVEAVGLPAEGEEQIVAVDFDAGSVGRSVRSVGPSYGLVVRIRPTRTAVVRPV